MSYAPASPTPPPAAARLLIATAKGNPALRCIRARVGGKSNLSRCRLPDMKGELPMPNHLETWEENNPTHTMGWHENIKKFMEGFALGRASMG